MNRISRLLITLAASAAVTFESASVVQATTLPWQMIENPELKLKIAPPKTPGKPYRVTQPIKDGKWKGGKAVIDYMRGETYTTVKIYDRKGELRRIYSLKGRGTHGEGTYFRRKERRVSLRKAAPDAHPILGQGPGTLNSKWISSNPFIQGTAWTASNAPSPARTAGPGQKDRAAAVAALAATGGPTANSDDIAFLVDALNQKRALEAREKTKRQAARKYPPKQTRKAVQETARPAAQKTSGSAKGSGKVDDFLTAYEQVAAERRGGAAGGAAVTKVSGFDTGQAGSADRKETRKERKARLKREKALAKAEARRERERNRKAVQVAKLDDRPKAATRGRAQELGAAAGSAVSSNDEPNLTGDSDSWASDQGGDRRNTGEWQVLEEVSPTQARKARTRQKKQDAFKAMQESQQSMEELTSDAESWAEGDASGRSSRNYGGDFTFPDLEETPAAQKRRKQLGDDGFRNSRGVADVSGESDSWAENLDEMVLDPSEMAGGTKSNDVRQTAAGPAYKMDARELKSFMKALQKTAVVSSKRGDVNNPEKGVAPPHELDKSRGPMYGRHREYTRKVHVGTYTDTKVTGYDYYVDEIDRKQERRSIYYYKRAPGGKGKDKLVATEKFESVKFLSNYDVASNGSGKVIYH